MNRGIALSVSLVLAFFALGFSPPAQASSITAGYQHTCAVAMDGTVKCWGTNGYGELGSDLTNEAELPLDVTGIINAVSVVTGGGLHTCALLSDGTATCWGGGGGQSPWVGPGAFSYGGIPISLDGITTATMVAAGDSHACALLADGTIQCSGENVYGQLGNGTFNDSPTPVTVTGITTATAITAGGGHTCALLSDGTIHCWGDNTRGELGDGSTIGFSGPTPVPVTVSGITTATAISAGFYHTCALLEDGAIRCWGNNGNGELGNGTTISSSMPVSVTGITTATAISAGTAGNAHTCAVLSDGRVQCWGNNEVGQLGNGTTSYVTPTPVTVIGMTNAVAVAVGGYHTCAIRSDGAIQCWGDNSSSQLATGVFAGTTVPALVSGLTSATAITAGLGQGNQQSHTCTLRADGTVWCWGDNSFGQLGNLTSPSATPAVVTGITTATAIDAGSLDTCALLADRTVQCWGYNGSGQLGDGTFNSSETPVLVVGITTATAISAGSSHTCALLADGTIQCWGAGSPTPVAVTGITTATAIAAGGHTYALLADGTIQCWGAGSPTPVAVTGIATATAIAAGEGHTCALLANGTIQCWGNNGNGQLGNGTTTSSLIPVTVTGITTAVAVAAGYDQTCALLSDGTIQCWGNNGSGQLGDGVAVAPPNMPEHTSSSIPVTVIGINTATAVAAGEGHTCAVLADGTGRCWGHNDMGQLGTGAFLGVFGDPGRSLATPVLVSGITTFNTSSGSNVTVPLGSGVTITFSNISQPAATTLTTSDTGTMPPTGFQLGDPPTYYDLTTDAVFSGPITVCINYTGVSFTNEADLKLFHFEGGAWTDKTVSLDTVENIICASVDSLSPFAIFEPEPITDIDGDGVLDSEDSCPDTSSGASVNAQGCSGAQLITQACPGPASFKNHGQYVSCVAHAADGAVAQGLISPQEKGRFVREAAHAK